VRGGYLAEPLVVRFAEIASAPKSAEQMFREYLETPGAAETGTIYRAPTGGADPVVGARYIVPAVDVALQSKPPVGKSDLSEHLWLLARWFYSKDREGEIFFYHEHDRQPGWPYRRILRACSRLLAPEPKEPSEKNARKPAPEATGTPEVSNEAPAEAPAKTAPAQQNLFDKTSGEGVT